MARGEAARRLGIEVDAVQLTPAREVSLPTTGRRLARYKSFGTTNPVVIDVDLNSGIVVDGNTLAAEDAANARRARGKISSALSEHLNDVKGDNVPVPVVMWLNAPTDDGAPPLKASVSRSSPELDDAAIESLMQRAIDRRAAETAAVRGRALGLLRQMDAKARVDDASPVAYAKVPRNRLSVLQATDDVVDIDLDDVRSGPDLDNATSVIRADPEVHDDLGIVATAEKIGQIESGTNLKIASHSCLDQITQSGTTNNLHATGVAGVMICHFDGISHGADLRLGSGTTQSDFESAAGTIRTWGAKAFNLSYWFGTGLTLNSHDKFYDDYFSTYFRTIVKSAGNRGTMGCPDGNDGRVTHPGLAYNVLTVGNLNDQNTVDRADDTMNNCSSWANPTSTQSDREKPEVAAPGTDINLPNTSGGFTAQTGTSFAAPMVTGTATLMMSANNTMRVWPEIIKAAIMATAHHNLEGDARLSEVDGAGGIDARDAVDVVRPGGPSNSDYRGDAVTCSSFPYIYTFNLTAGRRTRFVAVWHQDPTYSDYTTQPGADLDLEIFDPVSGYVGTSNSWDNTYEIMDFVPTMSGTYGARVNKARCSKSPKYIAVAWWQEP